MTKSEWVRKRNGRRMIWVKEIPLLNIEKYVGDVERQLTPLDQLYLDALEIVLRYFCDEIFLDKTKIFISTDDFNLMFNRLTDFFVPFLEGNKRQASSRAGALWSQVGPTVANFVPKGIIMVERGYIYIRHSDADSVPPITEMH